MNRWPLRPKVSLAWRRHRPLVAKALGFDVLTEWIKAAINAIVGCWQKFQAEQVLPMQVKL